MPVPGLGTGLLGVGMGVMSLLSANEQAEQQRLMAAIQHAQGMSNRNWGVLQGGVQNVLKNIEISRINQARHRANRSIEKAAMTSRAIKERALQKNLGSQLAEINNGLSDSLAKRKSVLTGKGLGFNSGTYKALEKSLVTNTAQVLTGVKVQNAIDKRNIKIEYENKLKQRDLFGWNNPEYYVPGQASGFVDPGGMSFLQGATAALGGAAQGISLASSIIDIQKTAGVVPDKMWT